jgi:Uma2 family endonuclease
MGDVKGKYVPQTVNYRIDSIGQTQDGDLPQAIGRDDHDKHRSLSISDFGDETMPHVPRCQVGSQQSIIRGKSLKETIVSIKTRATIEDLYKVEGKAELVDGEIVHLPPSGDDPGFASLEIATSLRAYARRTRRGRAYGDGTGFHVDLPHREAFSPDAAYHIGARTGLRFPEGAPAFAVEIRSENDYGPAAERAMQAKRADYFACGTLVVWDVDLFSEDVIKVYRASDPGRPTIYRRGDIAEAEPAVLGWRLPVDDLFEAI